MWHVSGWRHASTKDFNLFCFVMEFCNLNDLSPSILMPGAVCIIMTSLSHVLYTNKVIIRMSPRPLWIIIDTYIFVWPHARTTCVLRLSCSGQMHRNLGCVWRNANWNATSDKDNWKIRWTLDKDNEMKIENWIGIDGIDNGISPKYKKYLI